MKKKSFLHDILFYGVLVALIVVVLSSLFSGGKGSEVLTYDDVLEYFQKEQVREVVISPKNVLTMVFEVDGSQKQVS